MSLKRKLEAEKMQKVFVKILMPIRWIQILGKYHFIVMNSNAGSKFEACTSGL